MDEDTLALIRQIQDLTRYLEDLNGTVLKINDTFLKKFGVAMDKNTEMLDKNTQSIDKGTKSVDQFGQEIKSATDATKRQAQSIEKTIAAQQRQAEEFKKRIDKEQAAFDAKRRETTAVNRLLLDKVRERSEVTKLIDTYGRGISASDLLKEKLIEAADAQGGLGGATKIALAGLEGLNKGLMSILGSLDKGQRGAAVFAKATTDLSKPLTELGSVIGTALTVASFFIPVMKGLGIATKLTTKGLQRLGLATLGTSAAVELATKINQKMSEQTDVVFQSFNELSRAGVHVVGGFGKVFEMAQTLGMTRAEIEKFNKLLASNTFTLGLMGGTAAQGAERFAKVAGRMVRDFGTNLQMMGIDRDEQREIALNYMNIQARTGQIMNKSVAQLAKGSAEYAIELDRLAEATGTSRQAIMKSMEANLAESRYRAALFVAEKRYGVESRQFKELERAGQIAAALREAGMKEAATGTLQIAASGGAITTREALIAKQLGIDRMAKNLGQPVADELSKIGVNVEKQALKLGSVNKMMGETILQSPIPSSLDFAKRMEAVRAAAAAAGEKDIDKFMKTNEAKRILAGGPTKAQVEADRTWQNTQLMLEKVTYKFNDAAEANLKAAKIFEKAVGRMPGAQNVPGGLFQVPSGPGGNVFFPGTAAGRTPNTANARSRQMRSGRTTTAPSPETTTPATPAATPVPAPDTSATPAAKPTKKGPSMWGSPWWKSQTETPATTPAAKPTESAEPAPATATPAKKGPSMWGSPWWKSQQGGTSAGKVGAAGINSGLAGTTGAGAPAAAGLKLPGDPQKILDFIAKYESGGNYNKMVGGDIAPLTEMTVAEVLAYQDERISKMGKAGTAAGKYQIIRKTLQGLVDQGAIKPTDKFDAGAQEKLGRVLLDQKGYSAFKSGKLSADQFADNLAQTWAALPLKSGLSYWDGTNGNKAGVSREEFMKVLSARQGGIAQGPSSGYRAVLHGTEAIVPLPNNRSIPVDMQNMGETFSRSFAPQLQAMQAQISRLDELISLMRRQANTGERMLQLKQA